MMPIVSTTRMTARQFLQLGEDPPGVRLELVDGEVAVSPSPNPQHSFTDTRLRRLLDEYVEANQLGQVFGDLDTILGPHLVRRPDVLFVSRDRLSIVTEDAVEGPPDLCVEIISPTSATIDRADKLREYAEAGVPFYWLIDPHHRSMEGHRLSQRRYMLTGRGQKDDVLHLPPFEPLAIPLSRLWRPTGG